MLVLTRKLNEKIRIGSSITITVVRLKGKAVRIGIEAPADVNVLRGELAFDSPQRAAPVEKATMNGNVGEQSDRLSSRQKTTRRGAAHPHRSPTAQVTTEMQAERASLSAAQQMVAGTVPLAEMVNARTV